MNSVMIVTGASKGIGAAIAVAAAKAGYRVAVNYASSPAAAEDVVAEIRANDGEAVAVRADVSTSDGAAHLFLETERLLGSPAVVVCNAGITGKMVPIEDTTDSHLQAVFGINVFGTFYCTREAARRMSTAKGGRGGAIILFSSAGTRHGSVPGASAYVASKGAIDSLTVALSKELGTQGIRINTVRPGMIETSMLDAVDDPAALKAAASATIPLRRLGQPEEIAEAVLWLASDAASYVHGAILDVGGGR